MNVPRSFSYSSGFLPVLCCLLACGLLPGCGTARGPAAASGVLDLAAPGFSGVDALALEGEWEHYPGVFLDPSRDPGEQGVSPVRIRLPEQLTAPYWGTVRLRVRLPDVLRGVSLALAGQEQNTAARYYIDGRLLLVSGNVASDARHSHPAFHRQYAEFVPGALEITILIHFSNHEVYNGFFAAPVLGMADTIIAQRRKVDIAQSLVTGALVMMLVYHLFLFLIRRDRSPLYFSIFVVAVIVRLLLTQGYLYGLMPAHAVLLMKLEYAMFFVMPPSFCLYLRSLGLMRFGRVPFRVMLLVLLVSCGLTAALPLVSASDAVLTLYQYYTLVVIIFLVRELVSATRRKLDDIWLFNSGTLLLAVFSVNDILHFLRVIESAPLSHFGLVVFVMFQSAILARRHARLLARVEHLNRNLEQLVDKKTEELNQTIRALEHASFSDSLTGVRNRRFAYEVLFPEAQALQQRWEYIRKFWGVLMLDIDHFKRINDTAGHDAGDRILKRFAAVLGNCVRVDDLVIRWGGEEFLLILKDCKPALLPDLAGKIISRIRATGFPLLKQEAAGAQLTASLGCCLFPFSAAHPGAIGLPESIRLADLALYRAKRLGRDRFVRADAGPAADELRDHALLDRAEEELEGRVIFSEGVILPAPL